jgi:hypothetical protein
MALQVNSAQTLKKDNNLLKTARKLKRKISFSNHSVRPGLMSYEKQFKALQEENFRITFS